jgi:hypothetical protein
MNKCQRDLSEILGENSRLAFRVAGTTWKLYRGVRVSLVSLQKLHPSIRFSLRSNHSGCVLRSFLSLSKDLSKGCFLPKFRTHLSYPALAFIVIPSRAVVQ